MSECVKVMIRARPINQRELNEGSRICIETDKKSNQVILKKPADPSEIPKVFTFDAVYDWNSTQRVVYDESAFPLVESVIEGYNGTIFAYGQTGCGKTHTMMGYKDNPEERGIIPNAFEHIFGFIDQVGNSGMKFLVRCSYLEIYNEDIRDLLGKNVDQKLDLKEDYNKGVFVKDLTCCIVKSIPEIEKLMNQGTNNRKVGETAMNATSSRSHSIFTIYIETSEDIGTGEPRIKAGKLNLVDLAGSERQSKTQAQGIRLKEATKINLSLSALGNVISALVDGKSQHIPYRDSKLTRLLQDSLGGNTKTVMIAALSPSDFNYDETLSTLRYASRAKAIKNKPRVNEDPKDALLKQYEEEIQKLKKMLEQSNTGQINLDSKDFGVNLMTRPTQEHLMVGGDDESVDQLLEKLARKGKKVRILDQDGDDGERQPKQSRTKQVDGPGSIAEQEVEEDDDEVQLELVDGITEDIRYDAGDPATDNKKRSGIDIKITQKGPSAKAGQMQVSKKTNNRTIIRDSQEGALEMGGGSQQLQSPETLSKEQLQKLIKEMEQRMVIGGQALQDQDKERERIKQQRQLQIKLRNERKKQRQLLEEKQKQEEELLLKQQQYTSMQDELEKNRAIIDKLRKKYQEHDTIVKDIKEEHEYEKQDLLDTVREQARELDFCNEIIKAMLKDNELLKLKNRAKYDDNKNKWVLPAFFIREREVNLPKIRNAQALVQQELDKREILFEGDPDYDNSQQQQARQKFSRGVNSSRRSNRTDPIKQSIIDIRQSRISSNNNYEGMNNVQNDRTTPNDNRMGPQNTRQKQIGGGSGHYQTLNVNMIGNNNNDMDNNQMNKKNVRSNVQLQPLNYKTGNTVLGSPTLNVDEIVKNQYLENHPLFNNQGSQLIKKGQLQKLQNNPSQQISLNLQPSDNGNGSFQMSIQATVSIEPGRRQQLAPLPGQSNQVSPIIQGQKQTDLPSLGGNQNPQIKKNRVYLQTLGSSTNNNSNNYQGNQ